jgi:hypothetical protein
MSGARTDSSRRHRAPNDAQLRRNLTRMLEAFGVDEAAEQRTEHLRRGRSPRTFRYQPGAFHREAVRVLGRGSSEEVAATIHAPDLARYLGTTPARRETGPFIVRVIEAPDGETRREVTRSTEATPTRQRVAELVAGHTPHRWQAFAAVEALPDRGGTILLTDGRRIAVEATTPRRLLADLDVLAIGAYGLADDDWPWTTQAICDAWSARMGAGRPAPADERRARSATEPLLDSPDGTVRHDDDLDHYGWWERRGDRWAPITHARAYDVLSGSDQAGEGEAKPNP